MLKIEITLTKPQLKFERRIITLQAVLLALVLALTFVPRSRADSGTCSGQNITLPFTDVLGSQFFCAIAQIYFQGISLGTNPTTYSPGNNVTREQMAALLSRTQNSVLNRGSRRAALNQFWTTQPYYTTTQGVGTLGTTDVSGTPGWIASDGADIWVTGGGSNTVSRVRGSDGKLLETWTDAINPGGVLVAMGRVFVTGRTNPGHLYVIDPSQPAGPVTTLSTALGENPGGMAFDGARIWTANAGSVSIITPGTPFTATNVAISDYQLGILYDGTHVWVSGFGGLSKLDANGAVIATVQVGTSFQPVYDGTNIWAPIHSGSVRVVRPSDGTVLATLTGNGLDECIAAAFDGQRILVTNSSPDRINSVSLFRAADFAPLGTYSWGVINFPGSVCSDGLYFWIRMNGKLARF